MAISPPSDIIFDVVRAADPATFQTASARLQSFASGGMEGENIPFSELLSSSRPATVATAEVTSTRPGPSASPAQNFEAVILQQFVETMLPDNAAVVYGEGATGEIWKSMMAEQIANQIAASGGVGIAGLLSEQLQSGAKV